MKKPYLFIFISATILAACGSGEPQDSDKTDQATDRPGNTPCDVETTAAYCSKGALVYCADPGFLTTFTCPEGFSCGHDGIQALCLAKCTKTGTKDTICSSSIQVTTICTELPEGFFMLPDYDDSTFCQNGCKNMKECDP